MALLTVHVYPDPVLRRHATPIDNVDREIRKLIDDMAETMYDAPGIGLAANQVGKLVQVIVIDLQKEEYDQGLIALINPRILSGEGSIVCEEGCLSVPEYFSSIKRHEKVVVEGLDPDGNRQEIHAEGLLAVVLQHEIDHLKGRLFIDYLNPLKRDIFKRKWKKRQKQLAAHG